MAVTFQRGVLSAKDQCVGFMASSGVVADCKHPSCPKCEGEAMVAVQWPDPDPVVCLFRATVEHDGATLCDRGPIVCVYIHFTHLNLDILNL